MPNHSYLSPDEIVATIQRSSLFNMIIEGKDDVIIYRNIEEDFERQGVSILQAGGRVPLLQVFDLVIEKGLEEKCVFICDSDVWIYKGMPEKYNHPRLISTVGFSIENDMFLDRCVESLLHLSEKSQFPVDLKRCVEAFAYYLSDHFVDPTVRFSFSAHHLLGDDFDWSEIDQKKNDNSFPSQLSNDIFSFYKLKFRGKSLMSLYTKFLNSNGRNPRYNSPQLLGIMSDVRGQNFMRIRDFVEGSFLLNSIT